MGLKYRMDVYQFYGPKPYIDKLREVINSLKTSGLVLISVDRLDLQVVIVHVGVICTRMQGT